ncbi:hypothetical protein [Gordonia liuliyuniae]|uniref:Uncharacterized protein n=1 Tax=Gordonia liuliyuniae TaxID=2911517 RepID=A0ABS9IQH7_9ACTN|nr:hypothetical protein [Gordonia liuliyuniae]MCF8587811.1 hypothetical protein [Gordonia liuliyuniae]
MATYRVLNPDEQVIDTKEFDSAQDAYEWFSNIEVPSHMIGFRMEVDQDGEWVMFDQTDSTGSSEEPGER